MTLTHDLALEPEPNDLYLCHHRMIKAWRLCNRDRHLELSSWMGTYRHMDKTKKFLFCWWKVILTHMVHIWIHCLENGPCCDVQPRPPYWSRTSRSCIHVSWWWHELVPSHVYHGLTWRQRPWLHILSCRNTAASKNGNIKMPTDTVTWAVSKWKILSNILVYNLVLMKKGKETFSNILI